MVSKIFIVILFTSLAFVINDVEADGWKFWKKSSTTTTSTTTESSPVGSVNPNSGVGQAIANAGNPSLAVGANNAGTIRTSTTPRPRLPNPGTEVGLEGANSRPKLNNQDYRNLAIDLTGAAEPARQPSKPGSPSSPGAGAAVGAATVGVGAAAIAGGSKKVYSSNPIYSKGNTVTDDDLEKLSEALFLKDNNNAFNLLKVNPAALQIPTISKVLTIYDNYQLDTRINEHISPLQRTEESLLVDTFLSTNVMSAAMRFLADKGFLKQDYYEYKDTLRRLWFNLYSRGEGKIGSSGFEHVFLTELKLGTEISGLHNWIYFNAEEAKNKINYLGYIKKLDLGDKGAILKIHAKFNDIDKPVTTMFVGTSPELEMALYTVCFLTRPDSSCPVSLGGSKFNIVTHKFRYRGNDLIGSAYPAL
ncbi:Similar to CG2145: Poly(U)-specific endoribonuclease homolog (Drosophila melanogaster) [Cotesia congregata]|uniref:Similar to CG2145: Poly(U)-specific endoribonuclease homolog (Drosophila melanogaster) n=1 Tax=Cotesia congregata TaxID=51543 RepID=A0A8J2HPH8_COTCN|nr:Similar to CG2145: Poly(U)-specific endoribonuclease homolog (Drosophila melanogaster) [Cotesia congregata]